MPFSMAKIIEAENLTKVYKGKVKAVDHISFYVEEGEIFGFLGPNGAGKTTTIKMLNTLASITEGKATVAGKDVSKDPAAVRDVIGVVPQELTADDELKGIENILLSARLHHVPRGEAGKRAKDLLKLVDLENSAERRVKTYSGGMRRRLQLAIGLIHTPKILFLDEPTLGLDIQTRTNMWAYLSKLNKEEGITIFMTTHYLEEADSLCKRIAIIDHGVDQGLGLALRAEGEAGRGHPDHRARRGAGYHRLPQGHPRRLRREPQGPGLPDQAPQDREGAPGHRGRRHAQGHPDQGDLLHEADPRPGLPRGHRKVDARRGSGESDSLWQNVLNERMR